MEEVARTGLPRWMDQAFWTTEIDPILLSGLRNASESQCESVETVRHAFQELQVGMIWDRLRRLRRQRTADLQAVVTACCTDRVETGGGKADASATAQLDGMVPPSGIDRRFWRTEVDRILLRGIRTANRLERETVDRVLRKFSELRIGTIWARLRRPQEQRKENGHTVRPFRWTNELDERLIHIHEKAGLSAAVSGVQSPTARPRKAILLRRPKNRTRPPPHEATIS